MWWLSVPVTVLALAWGCTPSTSEEPGEDEEEESVEEDTAEVSNGTV